METRDDGADVEVKEATDISNSVWFTWEKQIRNRSVSSRLGVPIYEIITPKRWKYLFRSLKTLQLLIKHRPHIAFCQNPSIILAFLMVLAKRIFNYRVVVDQHNAGLFPLEGKSRFLNAISRLIVRQADINIVTNQSLEGYVQALGGEGFILPDPLPDLGSDAGGGVNDSLEERPIRAVLICSWEADEPYLQVFKAVAQFQSKAVELYVTGKPPRDIDLSWLPSNVTLAGFLDDGDYVDLLRKSDLLVVLTTREDCLNCGAYEAVSLGKPGILSDTAAIRGYFSKGFVYTNTSIDEIQAAFIEIKGCLGEKESEVVELRNELHQMDAQNIAALKKRLSEPLGS